MSRSHINSKLGLKGISNSIDKDTTFLAHYDISLNDVSGITPLGEVIDDDTVLSYQMSNIKTNSAGTFIVDSGMRGNHAQVFGATIDYGRNGKSMRFNGVSDYIETSPLAVEEELTISFWINFETTVDAHSWIFSNRSTTGNGISIFLLNKTVLCYDFGGSVNRWNTGYSPPIGEWLNIALTRNKSERVLYVNGEEISRIGSPGDLALANLNLPLSIGCTQKTNYFKGMIDTISICSKALSVKEVNEIYNEPVCTLYPTFGRFGGSVAIEEATTNLVDTISTEALGSVVRSGGWNDFDSTGEYMYDYTPLDYIKVAHNKCWVDINKDPINDGGGSVFGSIGIGRINVSLNTTYTVSFYLKVKERDYFNNNFLYLQQFNSSGVQLSEAGIANTNNRTYLGDGWYRIFATFTTSPTTTQIQIQHYQYDTFGNEFWFFGAQLEQKSFATSFVEGSREDGKLLYPISLLNYDEGTICFWMKYPQKIPYIPMDDNDVVFLTCQGYGGANSLNFCKNQGTYETRIIGIHWGGVSGSYLHVSPSLSDTPNFIVGGWNLFTITWDRNKGYDLYINGVFHSGPRLQLGDTLLPFMNDYFEFNKMMIDELRIDKVARTEEEILAWYVSGVPFYPRGIERSAY